MVTPNPGYAAMAPPVVEVRRRRAGGVIGWLLLLLALGGGAAFYVLKYRPMQSSHAGLMQTFNQRKTELESLRAEVAQLRKQGAGLEAERASLKGELDKAVAEKNAAVEELERTRSELSSKLGQEIAAGEVVIEHKGERLVVDVSDKVLFPLGAADISDHGKKVLDQVAESLKRVKNHVFQVGGHTDSAPIVSPKILERFPSNWELSATRATNVVRHLEGQGVPGAQLVASGFAQFRPVGNNESPKGRQRNRRIEIVLLRGTPKP